MKNYFMNVSILVFVSFFIGCNNQKDHESSKKESIYFGQKPPGLIPEIFAPEVVSVNGRYEYAVSFSLDLDEMYFSANKKDDVQMVYFSEIKDNKWTSPKRADFSQGHKLNELEAFVSNHSERIYFTAYDSIFSDEKIWYVNRLENSWTKAVKLNSPINDDIVFYSNDTKNGDLYYTSISKGITYYAPNKSGEFPEVFELGIDFGIHAFISPDQDFILVNGKNKEDDQRTDNDIYVYFKKSNGTWSKPINLGNDVNSSYTETCPSLTPDGKYLFFSRYNEEGGLSNIYWVDAEVIYKRRPSNSKN